MEGTTGISPGLQRILRSALFIEEIAQAGDQSPEMREGLITQELIMISAQQVFVVLEKNLDAPAHRQGVEHGLSISIQQRGSPVPQRLGGGIGVSWHVISSGVGPSLRIQVRAA